MHDVVQGAGLMASLRRDRVRLLLGLIGVAIAAVIVRELGEGGNFPVAVLLVPVMGTALIAGGPATAVVGAVAAVIGGIEAWQGIFATTDMRLRFGALVVGSLLAVALSGLRTRRDEQLAQREVQLALAEQQSAAQAIVTAMIDRLPTLTEAADIPAVAAATCRAARDLFGSDSASYWQVEGDDAVLLAREAKDDAVPVGSRLPVSAFESTAPAAETSRTGWVDRPGLARFTAAQPVLQRSGTSVGTSTPLRVGGEVVAYIGLGWSDERDLPDPAYLGALDRFADQVAIAKTVVRRRIAQQEAQSLGRRLQAGLLPVRLPDGGGVKVRSEYRPGTRHLLLGGDFLDVVHHDDVDEMAFLVGDVSGHGPEQAALGAMLRSAWVGAASLPSTSLEEWVRVLDYVVRERRPSEDLFVTAVAGRLDVRTRTRRYVLLGHPPPNLRPPSVEALPTGDPPLGVLPEALATVRTVELPEHWSLLLLPAGFYEGRSEPTSTERVGFDSFVSLLDERADDPLADDDYLRRLADDMEQRHGGALDDDAAALLLTPRCPAE